MLKPRGYDNDKAFDLVPLIIIILLLLSLLLLLMLLFVTIIYWWNVNVTIFFNHLSLVDQGIHKYVLCGRFSVFHMRQIK